MLRSQFKDQAYFDRFIITTKSISANSIDRLNKGLTPEDRRTIVEKAISGDYLTLCIAKYSAGYAIPDLLADYHEALRRMSKTWTQESECLKDRIKGVLVVYQQYASAYDTILWMLSLGILLHIPRQELKPLVDVIDRDRVQDILLEFLIRSKFPERAPIHEESYQKYFGIPKCFATLRAAVAEPNATKAQELIKTFVEKEWYKNHKDSAWYNNHKSDFDIFDGYWCFEAAAVVRIRGLDDSSFRDHPYYPKDLADWHG